MDKCLRVKGALVAYVLINLINFASGAGPLCYSCSHVPKQRDCTRIIQCGVHEKCYGRRHITLDGRIYFSSGCEAVARCASKRSIDIENINQHQKKALRANSDDVTVCDKCCEGDYCNIQLCDAQKAIKHRCLYCDDVINPEDCNLSLQCDDDQICYAEHIYVNKEKRLRLGCAHKSGCEQTAESSQSSTPSSSIIVGKRYIEHDALGRYSRGLPSDTTYCAKCCSGLNCNRDLCTLRKVMNESQLQKPPSLDLCTDYDTGACLTQLNKDPFNFCLKTVNRNLFCPRTCKRCSGGGIAIGQTTPAGSVATTTAPACVDSSSNCQQYASFFCDPTHTEGAKLCPKTCGLCGNTSLTMSPQSTVGTTKAPNVCVDPIPPCQCEYLQKHLRICLDGDPELKKFCCYYCKKVTITNWTCQGPDLFCDGKEQAFAEQIKGLNITCHKDV